MGRKGFHRRALPALLAMAALASFAAPGWGAPRERADLYLWLDSRGAATVLLSLDFEPSRPLALEQVVSAALGAPLRNAYQETEDGRRTLTAGCENAFRRRGVVVEGQVNPAPLLRLLRPLGVQWLTVTITHPRAGFSRCPGAQMVPAERRSSLAYFSAVVVATDSPPIRLMYGYRPGDLLQVLVPLVGLLLLPLGWTLWMRRAGLRSPATDPAAVSFGYMRVQRGLTIGLPLAWLVALSLFRAGPLIRFELGSGSAMRRMPMETGIALLPPLLVAAVCSLLLYPMLARVRPAEWTQGDVARQTFWGLAANLVPLLLVCAMLGALIDEELRLGVLWFAAAFLSRVMLLRRWLRSLDRSLHALTVGDLRDRIFALAQKAGVKVRQVYVLPAAKSRLANAFAMQGNNVLLTDYLLEHLGKREVDAIVAHELAHLKRGDPRKLGTVLVLSYAAAMGLDMEIIRVTGIDPWAPVLPALFALALMFFYFLSRRFECAADAGAIALTGDPEALITGLVRITGLNVMPIRWGRWAERFLTHPSTLRRAQAIARRGGISPERLQQILGAPDIDAEPYALPPSIAGEEKLFSTTFKSRVAVRNSWMLRAVMVLPPALMAEVALLGHWEGVARVATYAAGLVSTLALVLVASNFVPLWGFGDLQRRLRSRMEREGIKVDGTRSCCVGFAPDPSLRLYEGFFDWDMGLLFLEDDRLCYVGEQARFALRRDQVTAVRLGPGAPSWWRAPRISLTWRDEERGAGGAVSLRPTEARSMRQLGRAARALGKQLQAWREQPAASSQPSSSLGHLEAPDIGEVTSVSPRAVLNLGTFIRAFPVMVALAAGASVLLGLPFGPDQGGAAWYVLIATAVAFAFLWWPYLVYREPEGG